VQPSGGDNALGLVKFDMPNNQAIYPHDTAAPELFERSQRHLSHGCVRVSDAHRFAAMPAEQEGMGDAWI
jgi:murein L,D-transpeptidase YcbB/YkuD